MKKYGLQLRAQPSQQKNHSTRPTHHLFNNADDDDIEAEISRHATKNKALKDIEEQHRKALEEDPSVFDYDGVYDEMKGKAIREVVQERKERKPKYIQGLIEKAKQREQEHEIIYERKLEKERSKDDHLFADKGKFVTSAYKKKLAEQAKWKEEERLRKLLEEKEDVTKKSDLSDFYFNLSKNVAFGSTGAERNKSEKQQEGSSSGSEQRTVRSTPLDSPSVKDETSQMKEIPERRKNTTVSDLSDEVVPESTTNQPTEIVTGPVPNQPEGEPVIKRPTHDHHKRKEDALAAAKERFLARKRAKKEE